MHYGNTGYLNNHYNFDLPSDVLRPLGISRSCRLTGIPYRNELHPDIFDLMITPIPQWAWPKSLKLTIRILDLPGSLKTVAEALSELKYTIVQSEASRSGFRYHTWNLSVAIPEKYSVGDYNERQRIYEGTHQAGIELKHHLIDACKEVLFFTEEITQQDPVIVMPNSALSYFDH